MEGPIDMELKGYESIVHDHGRDLCVNMIVKERDSDWGDFRSRRAIDTYCLSYASVLALSSIRHLQLRATAQNIIVNQIAHTYID